MSIVYNPTEFNAKNLSISALKQLPSGGKQAYLSYGGERLVMQTVMMTAPFGLNTADKYGPPQYSIDLSFRGADQRPEVKAFMEVMKSVDDFMLTEGAKNSKAWFRQEMNREMVSIMYTPTVKISKDKEGNPSSYPPNIKLKLKKNGDDFVTKFYDTKGTAYKNVPVQDLLVKGVQVTAIIECTGMWLAGGKFGLTWNAKQVAINKLPEKISDFAFRGLSTAAAVEDEENEDEIDDEAAFQAPKSVVAAMLPVAAPVQAAQPAASSDSVDDEDGDDIEPVAMPVKKPTTTIAKKKIAVPKK
jgi:hypothetical protein